MVAEIDARESRSVENGCEENSTVGAQEDVACGVLVVRAGWMSKQEGAEHFIWQGQIC